MPITLGSNIASLRGQRQLQRSSGQLSTVFERLSSGQRINRASDDAAGLAIADSLRADSRVLGAAIRNINDGASLLNILDSALASQGSILGRLAELSEQAANGVYSTEQRDALDQEYRTLTEEFYRIADTTEFNGQNLLRGGRDGSSQITLQVGIDGSETAQLDINTVDTAQNSGVLSVRADYTGEGNSTIGDLTVLLATIAGQHSVDELLSIFGGSLSRLNVTDTNGVQREVYLAASLVNFVGSDQVGFSVFSDVGGGSLEVVNTAGAVEFIDQGDELSVGLTFSDTGATATLEVDVSQYDFQDAGAGDTNGLFAESSVANTSLDFSGLETEARARAALSTVTNKIDELGRFRGEIGALQSRLQTAAEVATVSRENFLAAESRIRDADVASEAASLIRLNILQQAASSVLAQANQQPQLALRLLQGGSI